MMLELMRAMFAIMITGAVTFLLAMLSP